MAEKWEKLKNLKTNSEYRPVRAAGYELQRLGNIPPYRSERLEHIAFTPTKYKIINSRESYSELIEHKYPELTNIIEEIDIKMEIGKLEYRASQYLQEREIKEVKEKINEDNLEVKKPKTRRLFI